MTYPCGQVDTTIRLLDKKTHFIISWWWIHGDDTHTSDIQLFTEHACHPPNLWWANRGSILQKCFTQNRRKDTSPLATKCWLYCCWSSEIIVAEIMMKFGVNRSLCWWNPRFSSSKFRFWWYPYHFLSLLPIKIQHFRCLFCQKMERKPRSSPAKTGILGPDESGRRRPTVPSAAMSNSRRSRAGRPCMGTFNGDLWLFRAHFNGYLCGCKV